MGIMINSPYPPQPKSSTNLMIRQKYDVSSSSYTCLSAGVLLNCNCSYFTFYIKFVSDKEMQPKTRCLGLDMTIY